MTSNLSGCIRESKIYIRLVSSALMTKRVNGSRLMAGNNFLSFEVKSR